MRVHVFGNSPSPAVATYGLRRAAFYGEPEFGSAAREFIHREFYVDDGLASLPSEEEAVSLLKAARGMLGISNLRLHKIASNCPVVMQAFPASEYAKNLKELDPESDSLPIQSSLGLNWDLRKDTFTFRVSSTEKPFSPSQQIRKESGSLGEIHYKLSNTLRLLVATQVHPFLTLSA